MPTHSRTISLPDGHNLQVRWDLASARLLRNIGIAAPSPITSFYKWPGRYKPLNHQIEMASFKTLYDRCFDLSEPGAGKTASSLWAADYLMEAGAVQRVLVMCPLSSTVLTWMKDIFDVLPHRTATVVHGTQARRLKNLSLPCDFYVLNHDGVDIEDVAKELRRRKDISLIILDEASFFRNHTIDRYRFLKWVMERKTMLWLLTGTPCPNAPTDAWALSHLVDPNLCKLSFTAFRDETMEQINWEDKDGNKRKRFVPKKGAIERAYEIMQPAIRIKKRDCIDLPPLIGPRDIQTTLSNEQKAQLKTMRTEMVMFAKEHQITAVNGADKLNKLRQILCGSVKDPNTGEYHHLDCHARIRDLRVQMSQAVTKSLVIAPFKGILRLLEEELPKPDKVSGLRGYRVLTLNGDVPSNKRAAIVNQFKTDPDIDGLVLHPRVAAHGLNLTEADTTIFYAPIYSNDEYLQVIERFCRLGQKHTMNLLRMVAHPIEQQIYQAVDERGTVQAGLLDLYQSFVSGKDEL